MHRKEYATSGGTYLKERGPTNAVPLHNYVSGDGKSHAYRGMAHYVPSERAWIAKDQFRSLPRETKRDAIDIQSEDQWVDFMRNRDTPSGYYNENIGLLQTGKADLKLFGYTRNLPAMPSKDIFQNPWPKSDAFVPVERKGRGDYYGYYHEAIESERERRKKEFPTSWVIEARDVPKL
ncbi:uncharacterized protein LOC110442695 [Mizuhopecten yessoensis]|uniref:Uncharacterized protein n=1 Tax=Mizuhopecten yessoensis TaxID=6573 RepID=A0A210PGN4_MIZYE|nr:uncharacterized protein LOC110442695 [Mizuhopecten yessoensis]OWF35645.1 hypothetical protein KP79_PYT19266 [Mizuhopecten yessoensis]